MTPYLAHDPNRATSRVVAAIANYFFADPEEVMKRNRTPRVALVRQIAMYVLREYQHPRPSLPEIGAEFGRDHTTVIAALRSVMDKATKDEHVRAAIEVGRLALDAISVDDEITRLELLRKRETILGELRKVEEKIEQNVGAAE